MQNSDWNTANALVKERKWTEALQAFERAFVELANDPDLIHDRAVCLFNLGQKKEALRELDRALLLQPNYSYRYASRAYMRNALRDINGAIDDYKKALELDPEDAISLNNLGMLEEQLGYRKEANERYMLADELNKILGDRGIDAPRDDASQEAVDQRSFGGIEPSAEPDTSSDSKPTLAQEMSKVFSSKQGFKEFVAFLRNGLKL
jgi:tetratricopeptide (TPR) repeat protein